MARLNGGEYLLDISRVVLEIGENNLSKLNEKEIENITNIGKKILLDKTKKGISLFVNYDGYLLNLNNFSISDDYTYFTFQFMRNSNTCSKVDFIFDIGDDITLDNVYAYDEELTPVE